MSMTLVAPAKLNLYLGVGAIRPDGYHAVTTVLVALDIGDKVTVAPAEDLSLVCDPPVGVPVHDNLAWRAATAMAEAFEREPSFAIRIEKRIPAGAGLGGGSADAAAVIAAMAAAWEIDRDDPRIEQVARSIGADVAFPLRGGCAVYAGRGDMLRRRLPVPPACFAIAAPAVPVSTAAAYQAFDAMSQPGSPGPRVVTDAVCFRDIPALGAALYNNMTRPSCGLVPEVGDALAFMQATSGCCGATIAGSGSAAFGVFTDEEDASAAARAAHDCGWWSTVARPRAGGTFDETMGVRRDAGEGRRRHSGRR